MFKEIIKAWLHDSVCSLAKSLEKEFHEEIVINAGKSEAHGDFACNIALVLAKKWSMPPKDIANAIKEQALPDFIEKCWVANPGFINITLCPNYLKNNFTKQVFSVQEYKQKIVVDYSAPNLAKALHVGHLRSSIIGDALVRINQYLGHEVIRQNHVGDWGTQFGMILAYLAANNITPGSSIEDLELIYQAAKKSFDESEEFARQAREFVVKLQSSDPVSLDLWHKFRMASLAHSQELYSRLGLLLELEDVVGESFYNQQLPVVVQDLQAHGLIEESYGALCHFSEKHQDNDGKAIPVILQKADGGYLYATTDLAAAKYRMQTLSASKILYVVDQRQALHFSMLFDLVGKCHWGNQDCLLEHVGFGTINDSEGKPFKTRSGGTIKLISLLDEAACRARIMVQAKQAEIAPEELDNLADSLAIASVKYNDLSKVRTSDYAFSYDNMLKFEGNTAPYILYAYVRLSKLAEQNEHINWSFSDPIELKIAKHIMTFSEVVIQAARDSMPHYICNYLYDLAVLAMKFYETCPINKAEHYLKIERKAMAYMITEAISLGLSLLGIKTIPKM